MLVPDLPKMGIKKVDVADQALVRSNELYSSAMNDAQYDATPLANPSLSTMGRRILAQVDSMFELYAGSIAPLRTSTRGGPRRSGAVGERVQGA